MKFKYDIYRPKRIIQDAWKANSTYFQSKDIRVTPLTKIGDADEVYKSQSSGRIPALAQKFKPKNRLVLSEILPRRKRISVRAADSSNKLEVRVKTLASPAKKQSTVLPTKDKATGLFGMRLAEVSREVVATVQRVWQTQRTSLSHLALVVLVIGAGAGSVHAYMNHSNAARTNAANQASNHIKAQEEASGTRQDTQPTAPSSTTPEPSTAPTPDPQITPQTPPANTDGTSEDYASSTTGPAAANSSANNAAAPQPISAPTSTAPVTPPPSAPVTTTTPTTSPTSQPQPTTPHDNTTPTQSPDSTQPTTTPDSSTSTNNSTTTTTAPTTTDTSTSVKDRRPSTQQLNK